MNQEMLTSIVRQLLFMASGYIGVDAATSGDNLTAIASGIVAIGTSIWALWGRRDKAIVAAAAAKVPVPVSSQEAVGITEPVKPK